MAVISSSSGWTLAVSGIGGVKITSGEAYAYLSETMPNSADGILLEADPDKFDYIDNDHPDINIYIKSTLTGGVATLETIAPDPVFGDEDQTGASSAGTAAALASIESKVDSIETKVDLLISSDYDPASYKETSDATYFYSGKTLVDGTGYLAERVEISTGAITYAQGSGVLPSLATLSYL